MNSALFTAPIATVVSMACAAADRSHANLEALLQHFPEFEIWSGVRELPYEIEAKLGFLRPQGGATG